MNIEEDVMVSGMQEDMSISLLKKIISDLKNEYDIKGACIVDQNDAIIASDLPDSYGYEADISKIMHLLDNEDDCTVSPQSQVMFAHRLLDYNGFKILVKKLGDKLTLLVIIHTMGYLSLAMLDIENSVMKIDEILLGRGYQQRSV